jgi:hypothetical protein
MKKEKDVFGEGYLARFNFAGIGQNPYKENGKEKEFEDHVKWSAGWLEAEIQISDLTLPRLKRVGFFKHALANATRYA